MTILRGTAIRVGLADNDSHLTTHNSRSLCIGKTVTLYDITYAYISVFAFAAQSGSL
jgi:hypothetical protein